MYSHYLILFNEFHSKKDKCKILKNRVQQRHQECKCVIMQHYYYLKLQVGSQVILTSTKITDKLDVVWEENVRFVDPANCLTITAVD